MILKNKYKIGSYVFAILDDAQNQQIYLMKIKGIYEQDGNLIYQDAIGVEAKEDKLFPDKQSALAELNKIKVGDTVYYLDSDDKVIRKVLVISVDKDGYHVRPSDDSFKDFSNKVFKTEEELVESMRGYE